MDATGYVLIISAVLAGVTSLILQVRSQTNAEKRETDRIAREEAREQSRIAREQKLEDEQRRRDRKIAIRVRAVKADNAKAKNEIKHEVTIVKDTLAEQSGKVDYKIDALGVQLGAAIEVVRKENNGMKDQLVEEVRKASFAKGVESEKDKHPEKAGGILSQSAQPPTRAAQPHLAGDVQIEAENVTVTRKAKE